MSEDETEREGNETEQAEREGLIEDLEVSDGGEGVVGGHYGGSEGAPRPIIG